MKPTRIRFCLLCLLAAGLATADNLIQNPGFEAYTASLPEDWDYFVAPAEGAFAKRTDKAHTGESAIMLHTPLPYEVDPVNNWSQNILGDFAEKKMRFIGYIRTKDATGAALWIQCWRKNPWGVLKAFSTATDSPVYGDTEWSRVDLDFTPPKGTDFLTVRAVLKGIGTAFFDDLELVLVEEKKPEKAEKSKVLQPSQAPVPPQTLTSIASEISRMRDANLALAEALEGVRDQNQYLRLELQRIQAELGRLQNLDREKATAPTEAAPAQSIEEERLPNWQPHQDDRNLAR